MANELQYFDPTQTGNTLYIVEFDDSGDAWSGAAYVTFTSTRDTFDFAATETAGTGLFEASVQGGAGNKRWAWFQQIGGTAADTDPLLLQATGYWDGTSIGDTVTTLSTAAKAEVNAEADTAITDAALATAAAVAAIDASGTDMITTTIATLASQVSFTITDGSADDDAYNGAQAVVTDASTPTQKCVGIVGDYDGGTKTVTLVQDPGIFTMAVGDAASIQLPNKDIRDMVNQYSQLLPASNVAGLTYHMRPGGGPGNVAGSLATVHKIDTQNITLYADVDAMLAVNESVDLSSPITITYSPGNVSNVAGTITGTGNVIEWEVTGGTALANETFDLTFYGDDHPGQPITVRAVLEVE